jgi:ubiquinone/menaquinone biosynthesis C-methylase UbiE
MKKPEFKKSASKFNGPVGYTSSRKLSPKSSSKPFTTKSTDFKKSHGTSFNKTDVYKKVTETKKTKSTSDTSWGTVASWYNDHLEKTGDTYHEKVIYPNLTRIIGDMKGKKILDLACGQGQFSRLMRSKGAHVTGIDLGKELIAIAESQNVSVKESGTHKAVYLQGSADDLYMLKDATFDTVVCILALQNIENLQKTIEEAKRVLTPAGSFVFVLNHPSFRNPRQTHWGYDEEHDTQFRRVDEYMSESHYKIDMTPGSKTDKKFTVSFHRPLQVYVKALSKAGLSITRLEEWVSHKESEKGPRQKAENKSRKEIPLFMCIECKE